MDEMPSNYVYKPWLKNTLTRALNKKSKRAKTHKLKRDWLLIIDLRSKTVKQIFKGPREHGASKKQLKESAQKLASIRHKLLKKHSPKNYEVILARADNLESLKKAFSDLSWDKTAVKPLENT